MARAEEVGAGAGAGVGIRAGVEEGGETVPREDRDARDGGAESCDCWEESEELEDGGEGGRSEGT